MKPTRPTFKLSRIVTFAFSMVALGLLSASAQVVDITLSVDTNTLANGESTTLRVFAQVKPGEQASASRIFSWYVDVLNNNGAAVTADYDAMTHSASDNLPNTSSTGTDEGSNRTGIRNTFTANLEVVPGPGVNAPVELMAIPITGASSGTAQFTVRAGTGVDGLTSDFLVAPLVGATPLLGGDYSAASIDVTTENLVCDPITLTVTRAGMSGPNQILDLTFTPCDGFNHTIQTRANLDLPLTPWVDLPGGPHNSGSLSVTNFGSSSYFRLSTTP